MTGFKSHYFVLFLIACVVMPIKNKSHMLDISKCSEANKYIGECIEENFEAIADISTENPIFPYKINYKSKKNRLSFCLMPIVECWALRLEKTFTFYMLVRNNQDVVKIISNTYGAHDAETSIEINDIPSLSAYHWDNKFHILVKPFQSVSDQIKCEDCFMIIFGNMEYRDIVHLSE